MHCRKALLMLLLTSSIAPGAGFSGEKALNYTREVVAIGPRSPGSRGIARLRNYLRKQLAEFGCKLEEDAFTAATPHGKIRMVNLIARFPGTSGKLIVVSGHYDTKYLPKIRFVGANDGGASTGFLIELARVLSARKHRHELALVWFDGEEAFGPWSKTDGIYGSRHLARKWSGDGTLRRLIGLINVDMIGDRDLGIVDEYYSTRSLARLIHESASELGYRKYFSAGRGAIEDDHVPFLKLGAPAVDLIDFKYGPGNEYWHTEQDTMDKLSARSFQMVGEVLLSTIGKLELRH